MSRIMTFTALVALGLGAGACTTVPQQLEVANNPSLYSLHQPVVQRTDFVLDLATSGEGLSVSEKARLGAWFASIGLRYGDTVTVDESHGYGNPDARADVAEVAAGYGLLLDGAVAPVTAGAVPPGSIRVIASRATAGVPTCPAWERGELAPVNYTSSNYGCATNSNLAAMIADPLDLVRGRDGTVDASANTAARAIRGYREGQPTGRQGLQQPSTTGDQ